MVKNCQMGFITPKYWLAAVVHFFSFIVVTAFSIYKECCDGELNADWKLDKKERLDFFEFREKLFTQMIKYNPADNKYPGDASFRAYMVQNSKQRDRRVQSPVPTSRPPASELVDSTSRVKLVSRDMLKYALAQKNGDHTYRFSARILDQTQHLSKHFTMQFSRGSGNGAICQVCGEKCYSTCKSCGVYLHTPNVKTGFKTCYIDYHDVFCFGLCRCDKEPCFGEKNVDKVNITPQERSVNRAHILNLLVKPREEANAVSDSNNEDSESNNDDNNSSSSNNNNNNSSNSSSNHNNNNTTTTNNSDDGDKDVVASVPVDAPIEHGTVGVEV
jgi:hypothetical protein